MKQLPIVLLCSLVIMSCAKQEDPCPDNKSGYDMTFDLVEIDYSQVSNTGDGLFLTCRQDLDFGIETKRSEATYWNNTLLPADYIHVSTSMRYRLTDESLFEYPGFELSFNYSEAKENLIETSDGTFIYRDSQKLTEVLSSHNWGEQYDFSNVKSYNNAEIKILGTEEVWPHGGNLSSEVLYFDTENFVIDDPVVDLDSGQVNLSGNFNLNIKVLSCGFYLFYELKNGHFETVINPCTL